MVNDNKGMKKARDARNTGRPKQYLTRQEVGLAKKIYRDLRESRPNPNTPELIYLGFVKNIPDRTGLEEDLEQLKTMIYGVAKKMAEIERKSIAKHGEVRKRIYSQFDTI